MTTATTATTATTETKWQAGDKCATVGRDGTRTATRNGMSWPIWTGKIYTATTRKSDGRLIWRLTGRFGATRTGVRPSESYVAELRAEYEGSLGIDGKTLPWKDGIRQNDICNGEGE